MKTCDTCKHVRMHRNVYFNCYRPNLKPDPVSGTRLGKSCYDERAHTGPNYCSPQGQFHEEIEKSNPLEKEDYVAGGIFVFGILVFLVMGILLFVGIL